jgi:hypothetical protein
VDSNAATVYIRELEARVDLADLAAARLAMQEPTPDR